MLMFSLCTLVTGMALAQDSASEETATTEEEVKALRERVRLLEKAVDELRGAEEVVQEEIPLDLETRIHGYSAINLQYLEDVPVLSFAVDDLIFQYTANLDRKLMVNAEFAVEAEEEGVEVAIEAMEIIANVGKYAQIDVGVFQLPISPWATGSSEGSFRFLPATAPHALDEEEGTEFNPIEQNGIQLRGSVPIGFWQLSYVGAATNGRAPDPGTVALLQDYDNNKAVMGRVAIQAPAGLKLGVGGYWDRIDVHDHAAESGDVHEEEEEELGEAVTLYDEVPEVVLNATLEWLGGPVELHSEVYTVAHVVEGTTYQSFNGFAVVGVPLRRVTPYLMVDVMLPDPADPIYDIYLDTDAEVEVIPGVRYDLGLHLAFKAQSEVSYEIEESTWRASAQLQLAAGF